MPVLCVIWSEPVFLQKLCLAAGAGSAPNSLCLGGSEGSAAPEASMPSPWDTAPPASPASHPLPRWAKDAATGSAFPAASLGAPTPKCCRRAKLNSTWLSLCFSKDKLKGRRNVFSFAFVISLSGRYFLAQFAGERELPAEPGWLQSCCRARHEAFLF